MARPWLAGLVVVSALACSEAPAEVALTVTPEVARADELLEVAVEADGAVTLTVTATDAADRRWSATADDVDPDDATRATAVLLATLAPDDGEDELYAWGDDARTFTVAVTGDDGAEATTEVERHLAAAGVDGRPTTLADEGFVGHMWTPATRPAGRTAEPTAAIVLIGGSEGGLGGGDVAPLLASHGIPALQVGLFGLPGLPADLREIPIETVAGALTWLGRQPGVDPDRVWVLGGSRGSEAALLAGAHFPDLVAGVVATVPSSVVNCALPDCDTSAWTLDGRPLPFWSSIGDIPAAADIPVEGIDGPVITTCGERDALWFSCRYADRIEERRAGAGGADLRFDGADAGHGVGIIAPQIVMGTIDAFRGGRPTADEEVRLAAWPAVLEALGA